MNRELRFLFIFLLMLGVFFRFVYLDRKTYWIDETYTSLRISGYTETEVAQQVSNGQVLSIQDLQKYQQINPEKSVSNTINGLATEEPQLTPLYFVMVRFWAELFGSSRAVVRSLSAFLSLLTFPCLYWLCRELFESPLVAWVAMTLIAISPFHLIYAQEARPYSLWMVTTILSSASLLRAIRVKTKESWFIYALTVAIGLYSHLFFLFVVIAHGIYVVAPEFRRWSKTVKAYLLASVAGILTFIPWIWIVMNNVQQIYTMTPGQNRQSETSVSSLLGYIKNWTGNISRVFIDFGFSSESPSIYLIVLIPIILLTVSLVIYSLYYLCRHTPRRVWLFILALTGVNALCLALPDLMTGAQRSVISRYFIPSILGTQIAVAYFFASQIGTIPVKPQRQLLWKLMLIALVTSGVLSGALNSQAQVWWNQRVNSHNPTLASMINEASQPLVLGEALNSPPRFNILNIISLSYYLNPNVKFQFAKEKTAPEIAKGFSNVFLFSPSQPLKSQLEKKYNSPAELVYKDPRHKIWLLKVANQ